MRTLSSLGIGLSLVFGCFLLALVAEVYYLLWWKKRIVVHREKEGGLARELLSFFCWKRPSSLSPTALNPQEMMMCSSGGSSLKPFDEESGGIEAELMRLHNLSGPPRLLFTIKEETKEDLESEDGKSRGGGGTPFLTPLSSPPFFTPPLTPLDCYNPLFESSKEDDHAFRMMVRSSPPPKFKFLKDAEEKLYRKTLMEEALRAAKLSPPSSVPSPISAIGEEEDGSFITLIIGKNREKGHHHHHHYSSASQVTPLPSSPLSMRSAQATKLITHLGSKH